MATSAADQLYPLSTDNGVAIPLDIVRPLGSIKWTVASGGDLAITIPGTFALVSVFSNVNCLLDFSNTVSYPAADATKYESSFMIPADTILTLAIPSQGAAKLVNLSAEVTGLVVMNCLQKWAGIGLRRQLERR